MVKIGGARRTCTPVSGCRLISLAPSPGSLARYMLQKCSRPDLHRHKADLKLAASASWATGAENGPPGRICTRNFSFLRGAPLLVGLQGGTAYGGKWSPRQDLHPHCLRSERSASALGYVGKVVLPAGFAPATVSFEASRADLLRYGSVSCDWKLIRPRATELMLTPSSCRRPAVDSGDGPASKLDAGSGRNWMPHLESHQDLRIQSPSCYCCTTGQKVVPARGVTV